MKKLLIVALLLVSCGPKKANLDPLGLFTNPDGSANVQKILQAVKFGLDADCAIPGAIAQDICAVGEPAIQTALAAANSNPTGAANSAADSLQATLNILPSNKQNTLAPYFTWAINLLKSFK